VSYLGGKDSLCERGSDGLGWVLGGGWMGHRLFRGGKEREIAYPKLHQLAKSQ